MRAICAAQCNRGPGAARRTPLCFPLFYEGVYIPNLELAHHPFRRGDTYEEYLGPRARRAVGKKRWNKHVARALEQIEPIWNPRRIYPGAETQGA